VSRDGTSIAVKVSALTVDPFSSLPVVIMTDERGRSVIPVAIGLGEAPAIAAELDRIELERPMSHQLLAALLAKAGAEVEAVEICDLVDNTFHAAVHLALANGERVAQEARPSDAIALALRTGAEIRVATEVMDKLARVSTGDEWGEIAAAAPARSDESPEVLEGLADEAFGKWKV
jgi:bifunctional DNase/RNase